MIVANDEDDVHGQLAPVVSDTANVPPPAGPWNDVGDTVPGQVLGLGGGAVWGVPTVMPPCPGVTDVDIAATSAVRGERGPLRVQLRGQEQSHQLRHQTGG